MDRYTVIITWSRENRGYIATVKECPGCSAWGSTRVEAAEEVEHAIKAWCEANWKAGNAVPAPPVSF